MPAPKETPPRKMKFDVFTVELQNETVFADFLENAAKLKEPIQKREREKDGTIVRWEFLERDDQKQLWTGDITHIRNDVVPNKASPGKPRERLKIGNDEGTTEDTAFGYDPVLNVLICQSNRFGVSGHDIVAYFSSLSGYKGAVYVPVVLAVHAADALAKFNYFYRLRFKVALPKKGPIPKVGDVSTDSAINMAVETGARYAEVDLSVGRSSNQMEKGRVSTIVGGLMNLMGVGKGKNKIVRNLFVSGQSELGERKELDLIKDRLKPSQPVDVTKDRDLPYLSRKEALIKAFGSCKPDLDAQFLKSVTQTPPAKAHQDEGECENLL